LKDLKMLTTQPGGNLKALWNLNQVPGFHRILGFKIELNKLNFER
jgi:hypothetical protein